MRATLLFTLTAFIEIFGCNAIFLWLRLGRSSWWAAPAALCLGLFA